MEKFDFSGNHILVTGGTGFIGGRLVEKLILECNASSVRVLVRNFSRVSRIARFPVNMIAGDITNPGEVEKAVSGCDVVFHCAWEVQSNEILERKINVQGTKNVLEAAKRTDVSRMVHLSTVLVYGSLPDGDFDETTPCRPANAYAKANLEAERLVLSYTKRYGLPAVVLQPTIVYGPFGRAWTIGVLKQLKRGRVILVNGGQGFCNAIYVDDMVNAMLLAAVKEKAIGEVFLISGEQPVTWRQFYSKYEQMLGFSSTVSMSAEEAEAFYAKKIKKPSLVKEITNYVKHNPSAHKRIFESYEIHTLKRIAERILPETLTTFIQSKIHFNGTHQPQTDSGIKDKPILPLHPSIICFNAARARARIDKAKQLLGYQPLFNFELGMQLTERWARWANLLDSKS